MSGYGPKNKQEFYDGSLKEVEKNIRTFENRTSETHTRSDHGPRIINGVCVRCGWLDPKNPLIKAKGPDGLTILEHAKDKLESFKLAKSLMAKMTPEELFALAVFVLNNYGKGPTSDGLGLQGLLLASLLVGSGLDLSLNLSGEDLDLEQDLGFAEFLARHGKEPVD